MNKVEFENRKEQIFVRLMELGVFSKVANEQLASITLPKKSACVNGTLKILRTIFPDNYVGKDSRGDKWIYTIYPGDKETQKFLNEPLKFESPRKELKKYLDELRNSKVGKND